MLERISINCHSSIKIQDKITIYIDPFKIQEILNDADYIFITHSHYDHCSVDDISKVIKKDTKIITTSDTEEKLKILKISKERILEVKPNEKYELKDIKFSTIPAYNINKNFHTKENNWVGYIIEFNGIKYYVAGDTDNIKEIQELECDIAFLPIGGTYTMNAEEAACLANTIKANLIIPIHYGEIVGDKNDLETFLELVKKDTEVLIRNKNNK